MAQRIEAQHIAPCGVDCAVCYAYQREKDPCPGCTGEDEKKPKHCVKCAIYTCETRRAIPGGSCATGCSIYPCKRLRRLDGRYRATYKLSLLDNLDCIAEKGMEDFLNFENNRFHCENCGALQCVQERSCPECGWAKRLF